MITVTDTAVVKIKELLKRQESLSHGLRMKVVGGGCSGLQYQLDFEKSPDEDDNTIESGGIRIFVDMKSALYLTGTELDYDDGLMGAGFKINNPNATNQCGCGESFSV